jgi:predicted transglutaminase-like cysteine proteinase
MNPDVWKALLPDTTVIPKKTIWDGLPKANRTMVDLLPTVQKIKMNWIQLKLAMINGEKVEDTEAHEYSEYLAFPSKEIEWLANQIVDPGDSNDVKAHKILLWVQENLEYVSDDKQYKTPEYWAKPLETLKSMKGDCEDGAFLIHSLMLNAGIPWEQIKTYGGEVYAGPNAPNGGHGWTVYQRESDDEWVVLDWCYYPNQKEVGERTPMKDDLRYIDDWFYITEHETVMTTYVNTIRDKLAAYSWNRVNRFVEGQRVDFTA